MNYPNRRDELIAWFFAAILLIGTIWLLVAIDRGQHELRMGVRVEIGGKR